MNNSMQFENQDPMKRVISLGKYNLQKFAPVEIESLNHPVYVEELKKLSVTTPQKSPKSENFLGNSTKYLNTR